MYMLRGGATEPTSPAAGLLPQEVYTEALLGEGGTHQQGEHAAVVAP